jgi:PPOX class probable F420-dependent enzyme
MKLGDLLGFLRRQRFGVISSVSPDGQPQAAVVGLAFTDEGEAVFDTVAPSRKARNLRRDPRASLVLWEGERTVQMEGRVDEPAGAERDAIVKVYLAAFPDGVERLRWEGITHLRFRPSWVRDSDFGAGPEPRIVELPSG